MLKGVLFMDYIMFAKFCIFFVFVMIIHDALRKVQVWGDYHKNYNAITKCYPKIWDILNSKEDCSEGTIILNEYRLKYENKEELLLKFELFVSSTMKMYEEIKEYSLISKNLKDINSELIEIYYKIRMMQWKNK